MRRTAVILVVGLTEPLLRGHAPRMRAFRERGNLAWIRPALPAVTCTAQSNYLTGLAPSEHGIVANGWFDRTLAEVQFWKQSDRLVGGRKLWEELKALDPAFTCAKLFWWYNMYSRADYSITPRPLYPADGRKVFDIHTWPYEIRGEIKRTLGEFPFATFWGPAAGMKTPQGGPDAASRWIAASAKWIEERYGPTLSLIYLPHLDYNFQRCGPNAPAAREAVSAVDGIVGELLDYFEERSVRVVLLSEYGITPVNEAVHLNRVFRGKGWLTVKDELALETLDAGASRVFAVADHQVAHIYLQDPSDIGFRRAVREAIERQPGVETVLENSTRLEAGLAHPRAGDLIAVAAENAWFTYYYWMDDRLAPDFARCVDIHRKPGYDPVELFLDPELRWARGKIAWRLLKKKLGMRMLMDVIPLDASLVKGSHGRRPARREDWPVLISDHELLPAEVDSTEVYQILKGHVLG